MQVKLSQRLTAIVNALPLHPGLRVLEIGCGPGAAARAIVKRIGNGHVLAIDRSAKAIRLAVEGSADEMQTGRLSFQQVAIEDFCLPAGAEHFDLAFAVRVGTLDGRHPGQEEAALKRIAAALRNDGKFFIDGGDPLKEISLARYR